nr:MAG TPA: hypothetical protein [Caudoviricetes sp.]
MFLVGKVGIFGWVGRLAWGDPTAYINRYFSLLDCVFGGKSWNFWMGGSTCMGGPNRIH